MTTRINIIGVQGLTGQTGTSSFAGSVSPSLVTPILGTPTSGTLTNCTGLPVSGIVSGSALANSFATDSGTATPSSNTITFSLSTANTGDTAFFSASGSTVKLVAGDGNSNTAWGKGTFATGSSSNTTIIGAGSGTVGQSGGSNTGLGAVTFTSLTSGNSNVALGTACLAAITSATHNVAIGHTAGQSTTGSNNILIGESADTVSASDSNQLIIGNGTGSGTGQIVKTTISGITGKTSAAGIAVLVNSSNVLGTTTSSIRYKENVQDIKDSTDVLMALRPVSFNYKKEVLYPSEREKTDKMPLEYGLIAEEAEKYIPELIVYDDQGLPETIRYLHLDFLMLKEIQKLRTELDELKANLIK